jgi:hypothetical protein
VTSILTERRIHSGRHGFEIKIQPKKLSDALTGSAWSLDEIAGYLLPHRDIGGLV